MLDKARCSNVEPMNADFLAVDPTDPKFALVSHMWAGSLIHELLILIHDASSLLDPSCSGSGIVNRLDHLLDIGKPNDPHKSIFYFYRIILPSLSDEENVEYEKEEEDRLQRLSAFQLTIIKHAMKCTFCPFESLFDPSSLLGHHHHRIKSRIITRT